jgi:hypothetical protein
MTGAAMKLKENYIIANCCKPVPSDRITGYYSYDNIIKVHKSDCGNLNKAEPERLIKLSWPDILPPTDFAPDDDYAELDDLDFLIMAHHKHFGIDYSLAVAAILNIDDKTIFERHKKLRTLKLLERVEPVMVQYRKNIVKNKWIKHRNHTYYDLTDRGRKYLDHYLKQQA